MRSTLRYSPEAVQVIYQIPRTIWRAAKVVVWSLQDDPLPANAQTDEADPSLYWIPLPGDYVLYYIIVDELHVVRILDIE
jgi:hypothetical protein